PRQPGKGAGSFCRATSWPCRAHRFRAAPAHPAIRPTGRAARTVRRRRPERTKLELSLDGRGRIALSSYYVPRVPRRQPQSPDPIGTETPPMRTYLICHDVAASKRHALAGAIMELGQAWARPLDTTWYVQAAERADQIERRLRPFADAADGLLIQE